MVLILTKDKDINVIMYPNSDYQKLLNRIPTGQSPRERCMVKELVDFCDGERVPVVIWKCHPRDSLSLETERPKASVSPPPMGKAFRYREHILQKMPAHKRVSRAIENISRHFLRIVLAQRLKAFVTELCFVLNGCFSIPRVGDREKVLDHRRR